MQGPWLKTTLDFFLPARSARLIPEDFRDLRSGSGLTKGTPCH